eukprot:scpid89602/ scgid1895/ 
MGSWKFSFKVKLQLVLVLVVLVLVIRVLAWFGITQPRQYKTVVNGSSDPQRKALEPGNPSAAGQLSSAPPMRHGRLAYLVMGAAYPAQRWIRRSNWPDTSVLYLSWKRDVTQLTKKHQLPEIVTCS